MMDAKTQYVEKLKAEINQLHWALLEQQKLCARAADAIEAAALLITELRKAAK